MLPPEECRKTPHQSFAEIAHSLVRRTRKLLQRPSTNRMLENDSSPLDGQQEKTRAYHTPVARQQELPGRHVGRPPCSASRFSKLSLFFSHFGILFLGNCANLECGRPSAAFLFLALPPSFPKSLRMNGHRNSAFCLVLPGFLAPQPLRMNISKRDSQVLILKDLQEIVKSL